MRLILTSVAAAALIGLAGQAFAHGGSYRGPAGEVPPDSREPSDPPPPPDGPGPGTPTGEDDGGPTTGGPGVGGPGTGGSGGDGPSSPSGGGGPPPGPGGGGGPTTGGSVKRAGGAAKGPGYEDWTFWWNFNKDEILNVKSIIKRNQLSTTSSSSATGIGRGVSTSALKSATETAIMEQIVPVLRELLDQKDLNFDIQSAAELALAKIGDTSIAEKLMEIARNDGKNGKYNKVVEESAALAFGLLQSDKAEIREFLIELARDPGRNNSFVRPFSAISLGLLGSKNDKDDMVAKALIEILNGDEAKEDIKPASLVALGLLGNDSQCETLLNMLKTGKSPDGKLELSEAEVAFVVQALGKIGRPGLDKAGQELAILDAVTALVDSKSKAEKAVRRSSAIALGQLAKKCDGKTQKKIVVSLKGIIENTDDPQERHFALIALGRIGAASDAEKETRADCVKVLNYYLDRGGKGLTPPFAAMGLGLIGRAQMKANETVDDDTIRKPIRDKFADSKDARSRGAYAIASGLVGDKQAVKALVETLQGKEESKLRGYAALALGMINDQSSRDAVKTALTNDSDRELRVQTALAAGLMADPSVIPDLVKILRADEESQYILGSVALALGQIGDERAIEPLVAIVKDDKKFPDLTRALATVALGQIGDRRDVPTLARVSTDINYRVHVPALTELLTIL